MFILWFSVSAGPTAFGVQKELVGAVGGSVTFPLTHSLDQIDSVIWFFKNTTLVTIQPTMTNKPDVVIVTKNHNKERIHLSNRNYSLKLSKLSKNDSGAYSVQIHSSSLSEPIVQNYGLQVYGEYNDYPSKVVKSLILEMFKQRQDKHLARTWKMELLHG